MTELAVYCFGFSCIWMGVEYLIATLYPHCTEPDDTWPFKD